MVHVKAIAQTRDTRSDLVELDALLAPVCMGLVRMATGAVFEGRHTALPDVHGVGRLAERGEQRAGLSGKTVRGSSGGKRNHVLLCVLEEKEERLQPDNLPYRRGVVDDVLGLCSGGCRKEEESRPCTLLSRAWVWTASDAFRQNFGASKGAPPIKQTAHGPRCRHAPPSAACAISNPRQQSTLRKGAAGCGTASMLLPLICILPLQLGFGIIA